MADLSASAGTAQISQTQSHKNTTTGSGTSSDFRGPQTSSTPNSPLAAFLSPLSSCLVRFCVAEQEHSYSICLRLRLRRRSSIPLQHTLSSTVICFFANITLYIDAGRYRPRRTHFLVRFVALSCRFDGSTASARSCRVSIAADQADVGISVPISITVCARAKPLIVFLDFGLRFASTCTPSVEMAADTDLQ